MESPLLYQRAKLLCAAAYAQFGVGFVFGFGGLVAGFGGASGALTAGILYAGAGLAGLGAVAALASTVLSLVGWIRSGQTSPWVGLLAGNLGFVAVVLAIVALYGPRGSPVEGEPAPGDSKPTFVPPLAVAPFDADQARAHQESWAKHLGMSVVHKNSIGMELTLMPPAVFQMGSKAGDVTATSAEHPRHEMEISRGFYLGKYEVTQQQYEKIMGVNPSHYSAKGKGAGDVTGLNTSQNPVESMTWRDAQSFCKKLSDQEGKVYRLPTEAEWEYACRAGTETLYHFGDQPSREMMHLGGGRSRPVGSFPANAFGLHDMHGNVAEMCQDAYDAYDLKGFYSRSPRKDPVNNVPNLPRMMRGGSWTEPPQNCRSATRWPTIAVDSGAGNCFGFRIVLTIHVP